MLYAEFQGSQAGSMTLPAMKDTRAGRIAGCRKRIPEGVILGHPLQQKTASSLGQWAWSLLSSPLLALFRLIFSRLLAFGIPSPQIQPPRWP
ncbi:rCG38448, isoform CRA_b [Rattus norvegicus]|uniref:RCG38448, isoform CRA_b n=1 Tax=Rattus norvegicus TaxID=10116 RepID=A6KMA2_RAT|nr:rCG38448, isoform CRA_b [Rattus norvegicus]